jgi:DNA-binding XRE family transcriptional regulator
MNPQTPMLGRRPVGFLTNLDGKRTHAIVLLEEGMDEWDALPSADPDAVDQAFLARFKSNPEAYLVPAPVKNPIRTARLKAKITQEILAKALGISAAALSKQEQEGHTPRPRTLERALKMLHELEQAPR